MKKLLFYTLLSVSLYTVKEPYKARTKQLCSRSQVITKPEPKQGKIFDKPIRFYEMPSYKYKPGFPTLGIDYLIVRV